MITIPVSTIEKPLTAVDYCAVLEQATSLTDVQWIAAQVPLDVRTDERFAGAVARRIAAMRVRKKGVRL